MQLNVPYTVYWPYFKSHIDIEYNYSILEAPVSARNSNVVQIDWKRAESDFGYSVTTLVFLPRLV